MLASKHQTTQLKPYVLFTCQQRYQFNLYKHIEQLTMSLPQQKVYLPFKLSQIILKLQYKVIQKLVLFKQDQEQGQEVRHYDYQCEGIAILKSFLQKKKQNILMKALHEISRFVFNGGNGKRKDNKKVAMLNLAFNDTKGIHSGTRRILLNTTNTISQLSPIKRIEQLTQESRSRFDHHSSMNQNVNNLQKLLMKVKKVNQQNRSMYNYNSNQHHEHLRNQQSYQGGSAGYSRTRYPYNNNITTRNHYYDEFQDPYIQPKRINTQYNDQHQLSQRQYKPDSIKYNSQKLSVKNSRRQYILEKFNQLQKDLSSLSYTDSRQDANGGKYRKLSENIRNDLLSLKEKINGKSQKGINNVY